MKYLKEWKKLKFFDIADKAIPAKAQKKEKNNFKCEEICVCR